MTISSGISANFSETKIGSTRDDVSIKASANVHRSAEDTAMNVVDGDLAGSVMRFKNGTSGVTAELRSERY